jgi:co-chaperonin GroES (HSP10)
VSDPKLTGNVSDELGQAERGADFESVNRSSLLQDVEPLRVTVESDGKDLLLRPEHHQGQQLARRGPGNLQQSARDELAAQVFADSSMMHPASQRIQRKPQRGSLVWYSFRKTMAAAMWGDRILLKQDAMESAYSCRNCKGTGHTDEICPTCKGGHTDIDGVSSCRSCQVLGYGFEAKHAAGFVPCGSCAGAGWAGGIVVPEVAQSQPITGIVVSIGPECVDLRLGDRVLHSKYAGHAVTTPEGETFTTMHEHEVLWLLRDI